MNGRAKWVSGKSKIGRFIEHKKSKIGRKKANFVKAYRAMAAINLHSITTVCILDALVVRKMLSLCTWQL